MSSLDFINELFTLRASVCLTLLPFKDHFAKDVDKGCSRGLSFTYKMPDGSGSTL